MKVKAVAFKEVLQTIALAWLSISRRNKKRPSSTIIVIALQKGVNKNIWVSFAL
jgi:hypothetical protein